MTVATLLVEKADDSGARWTTMLKRLFQHPILLGILAGLAFRLSGLELPLALASATKLMADAAAPTALFALGMTLKRYGLSTSLPLAGMISSLKLIVHPALVYGLAFHVLPMPPVWAAVAVLFAACPCGVNAYLLAQRYQVGVAMTSGSIALSTLLAVGSMTFWLWLVT